MGDFQISGAGDRAHAIKASARPVRASVPASHIGLGSWDRPAAKPPASREAAGLVKNPTSQTDPMTSGVEPLLFTRGELRLQRMRKAVSSACQIHNGAAHGEAAAMFTFTCRRGAQVESKDITRTIDNIRKWALRKLGQTRMRYVWVAELQGERSIKGDPGALHYHLVVWLPMSLKREGEAIAQRRHRYKSSCKLPKPDRRGWWKHGSTERDWVRTDPKRYLMKYLSKGESAVCSGQFPKGLQTHNAGGFQKLERQLRSYSMLPKWVREKTNFQDRPKRSPGGGFVTLSGHRLWSPYVVLWSGRTVAIVEKTAENMEAIREYFRICTENWFLRNQPRSFAGCVLSGAA